MAPDTRLFVSLAHLTMDSGRLDAVLHVADLIHASSVPLDTVRLGLPPASCTGSVTTPCGFLLPLCWPATQHTKHP